MSQTSGKRKTHTKSRKGCYPCKQRHTKCNEAHPQCANCIRLDIACTWPTPRSEPSHTSHDSPQSAGPEYHVSMLQEHRNFRTPDLISSAFSPTLPIDDMRLLHHWTAKLSFFHDEELGYMDRVWSVEVVEIGFQHPFLLHALLASAALHKVVLDPNADRSQLLAQADAHMSNALVVYRQLLPNPTEETAVPMFFLSSLLVTYNLVSAQIQEPDDPFGALVHCFRLLRGIKVVIHGFWPRLIEIPTIARVLNGVTNLDKAPIADMSEFKEVANLRELATLLDESDQEGFVEAVEHLHMTCLRAKAETNDKYVHSVWMTWPALIHTRFLDLAASHNPAVIIVLAHFAVLMNLYRSNWWTRGWPERVIHAANALVSATPDLQKWLDWPLAQLSMILERDRGVVDPPFGNLHNGSPMHS
ncbi:hypothetical protein B0J11DRAFT_524315 [Dendryphion nanum]|uniref:Zn(2)-C6 fungal-type domain-containing protein n=1 Tax=Dendryphion nanum TaxID=256645 RepID=A0A9P9IPV3_9PLEO|nr:hypothetical protein B0J11DRAFT_524315 [Dendryphion nanum]